MTAIILTFWCILIITGSTTTCLKKILLMNSEVPMLFDIWKVRHQFLICQSCVILYGSLILFSKKIYKILWAQHLISVTVNRREMYRCPFSQPTCWLLIVLSSSNKSTYYLIFYQEKNCLALSTNEWMWWYVCNI